MSKSLVSIFALCLCVLVLTAVATPAAHADSDAEANDKIKLPAFHKQTVKIDGKDVPIEMRWFDKPFPAGSTDPATLPDSATKAWIVTSQVLFDEKYAAFVDMCIDAKKAKQTTNSLRKLSIKEREKNFDRRKQTNIVGEIRMGRYALVVMKDKNVSGFDYGADFLTYTSDGYRTGLSPNSFKDHRHEAVRALSIAHLIQTGKLAPPADER